MAYTKKIWTNRSSEYPNRRTLTPTGAANQYDVSRSEGLIIAEGDAFDAETMNDLENRIEDGVISLYTHSLTGTVHTLSGTGANGKFKATSGGTVTAFTVNGTACTVKQGEEAEIELVNGCWYTFILDGNTLNFKSGGAGLNFKIVGGTVQPTNPSENMIWVNTAVAIGDWQFMATQPTVRSDGTALQSGDVWFGTGSISASPFNATKKNKLMVYVSSTKQWSGSTWINKASLIYSNRKWSDFISYLYKNGDEVVGITGGYTTVNTACGTATKYADRIQLTWNGTTQYLYPKIISVKPIEFGGFNTLNAKIKVKSYTSDYPSGAVYLEVGSTASSYANIVNKVGETLVISVDISNITTPEKIYMFIMSWYSTSIVDVTDIWLE